MCHKCSPNIRKIWVFGCGTFFLLFAVMVGLIWPYIATQLIHHVLQLKDGSLNYENWVETPLPMYLKITMFNWTNPEDFNNPKVKPNFVEMGPYVFLEKHRRVNIEFSDEKDTVAFDQIRTWHFEPELSNGNLTDEVTNVNVMTASAAFNVRHSNPVMKFAANKLLQLMGSLTTTKTVRELLFDGYDDAMLDFLRKARLPGIKLPPFKKFGWFVDRNASATYDGHFEMYSGQRNFSRMGLLTEWNHSNRTKYYYGQCSDVNGTSGELWPANMNATSDITFFVTDLCRPLTLAYEQQHTRFNVVGSKWIGDYRVFDNGKKYPPNQCFCTGKQSECPDLLNGVHNMSDCRYGAPVFASFPHFYLADQYYVDSVSGLSPNRSKHEFSLALEPTTGIPLNVHAKIQINILLQPIEGITIYKHVPKVMIPTFWFEQEIELDEKLAKEAKMALQLPSIGIYAAYGVSALGITLLLVGAIVTYTKSWSRYETLDDELTASSIPS